MSQDLMKWVKSPKSQSCVKKSLNSVKTRLFSYLMVRYQRMMERCI